jgi:PhzF family phenazine biosynthesis protein
MNLSETAFLLPHAGGGFSIRWFTPTVEVPLCGHATLASAHVLWQQERVAREQTIVFHTQSGNLAARREADWICLDFPAWPVEEATIPAGVAEALHCAPLRSAKNQQGTCLLELDSERAVREIQPDYARLGRTAPQACIVTARSASGACDFVSRFFAPKLGIDEDPVTGAAHCSLGPYWAKRLGKNELVGHQVSRRGGVVKVRVHGERVDLLGRAVTVIRGEFTSPT